MLLASPLFLVDGKLKMRVWAWEGRNHRFSLDEAGFYSDQNWERKGQRPVRGLLIGTR